MTHAIKRRRFLVGLGGLTVGLPALRALMGPTTAKAAAGDEPKRIIMMSYAMGTHIPMWAPQGMGSDFTLGEIAAPMEPFRDRALWISNVPHALYELGGSSYVWGHPAKKECALTGTLLQSAFSGPNHVDSINGAQATDNSRDPNGPSVDHVVGQALAQAHHLRPSVDLGVAGNGNLTPKPSDFHYEAAANPVLMQPHPGLAFASVFNGVDPDGQIDEVFLDLQRRRKSVLDSVRDSFTDLRSGLDAQDRAVLDDHADKIRQIELDMPVLPACALPDALDEANEAYAGMGMMELGELQNRILAHAMGCDVAPVGRIEYLDQHNPFFGLPEVDDVLAPMPDFGWHGVVHATDDGWTNDHPVRVAGYRFFVQKFADLCSYLDEMVEGPDGRTVLDNSLLVLASDFGEGGGHGAHDMCFLIAGGSGPGRRNFHVEGSGNNVNQVLVSIAQQACLTGPDGGPIQEFGIEGFSTGGIPGVIA